MDIEKREDEYLTEDELSELQEFLRERNISYAEIARRVNKSSATVGYWFAEKRFKRLIARDFIKKEKDRALEGFEKVDKI